MSSNEWDNTRTSFKKDLIDFTHPFHNPVCPRENTRTSFKKDFIDFTHPFHNPVCPRDSNQRCSSCILEKRGQRAFWNASHFSPCGSLAFLSQERSRTPALPSRLGPLLQSTPGPEPHWTRPAVLSRPAEAAYVPQDSPAFQNKAGPGQACAFGQGRFCPNAFSSHLQARLPLPPWVEGSSFRGSTRVLRFSHCVTRNIPAHTGSPVHLGLYSLGNMGDWRRATRQQSVQQFPTPGVAGRPHLNKLLMWHIWTRTQRLLDHCTHTLRHMPSDAPGTWETQRLLTDASECNAYTSVPLELNPQKWTRVITIYWTVPALFTFSASHDLTRPRVQFYLKDS